MTFVHGGERVVLDYFSPQRDAGGGGFSSAPPLGAGLEMENER